MALPVFVLAAALLVFSLANPAGFDYIWRYFSWANQVLAMVTLWAVTVLLCKIKPHGLWFLLSLVPALLMMIVTVGFFFVEQMDIVSILSQAAGYVIAAAITLALAVLFFLRKKK